MALNIEKLHPQILEALHGRGFTDEQIAKMGPETAFDQWCGWELGDPSWGRTFRQIDAYIRECEVKS